MSERVPLHLGFEFMYEGHPYVVTSLQATQNSEGRTLSIIALEPLMALARRMTDEERREMFKKSTAAMDLLLREGGDA